MSRSRRSLVSLAALCGALGLAAAGCGKTLIEQLTPTPGVATTSQFATALLAAGGTSTSTFTLSATTVVGVTLASVVSNTTGNVLSPTMTLVLGTQTSGTTCTPLSTQAVTPALSAAIQQTLGAGTYCVSVTSTGLAESAVVTVRINQSTTAPTSDTATAVDVFNSVVGLHGVGTHELPIAFSGTTQISLLSAGNSDTIGMGFGVWDGQACRLNSLVTSPPATDPLITVTVDPGSYCVSVSDVGLLTAPIVFYITTLHP